MAAMLILVSKCPCPISSAASHSLRTGRVMLRVIRIRNTAATAMTRINKRTAIRTTFALSDIVFSRISPILCVSKEIYSVMRSWISCVMMRMSVSRRSILSS